MSRPWMRGGDQPHDRWVVEEELRTLSTDYATAVDGRDGTFRADAQVAREQLHRDHVAGPQGRGCAKFRGEFAAA